VRLYPDMPLRAFFQRIAQKRGQKVAITALSRKLATLLWEVLTRKECE